ncbi:MAG: DUF4249 domain-containing protein [Bacteroidales bacterium]|nr:DUF4249 domain-containing protein [Bacteroidales bacterium]
MMRIPNYVKFSLLLFFVMGIGSCEDEEISWNVGNAPAMLVVEGSFTSEMKQHRITLSKTADYFINKQTPRVTGAEVSITDGITTFEFEEKPGEQGVYESRQEVSGRAGHSYTLNIYLDEPINNETHYQARETMIKGIDLESMEAFLYENPFYEGGLPMDSVFLLTYIYGPEPKATDNFYMVNLYRNGKLLRDTIDEREIYSDKEQLDGEYVNSLFFSESFRPGDTASVKISTVSKSYQQFVESIQNIANQSGNPFDLSGPPANAIGNIEGGEAMGYFRVSYVSRARAVVEDERAINKNEEHK